MAANGQAVSAGIERSPARAESAADGNIARSPVFAQGVKPRATSPPDWLRRIHPATWLLAVFVLFLPAFANDFMQLQVFGWAFVLGMIALSLMFLAGYGGMVSLVQMTVAACAGYMYAIFGYSAVMEISLGWPWWATIPVALIVALIFALIFGSVSGALAVRTEGIYTIMITLAIASAFFYFTRQNYVITHRCAESHDLDRGIRRCEPVRRSVGHHDAVLGHRRAGPELRFAQGAGERSARAGRHGREPRRRDLGARPRPDPGRAAGPPGDRTHDVRRDYAVRAAGDGAARKSLRRPPHGSPYEPARLTGPLGAAHGCRQICVSGRELASDAHGPPSPLQLTQPRSSRVGKIADAWR